MRLEQALSNTASDSRAKRIKRPLFKDETPPPCDSSGYKSKSRTRKINKDLNFTDDHLNEVIDKKMQGKEEVDVGLWKNMIFYKSIAHLKDCKVQSDKRSSKNCIKENATIRVRPLPNSSIKK